MERINLFDKIAETYQNWYIWIIHVLIVYPPLAYLTNQYRGELLYYLSGTFCGVIYCIIDHISSIPLVRISNTNDFREKKLYEIYKEGNPFIGRHPTMKQYVIRSIPQDIFKLTASTFFPPLGYTFISIIPFIYRNNRKYKK
jgi:hypothetical protein